MRIILDACPGDAPGCIKVYADLDAATTRQWLKEGREIDRLIQMDWDFPGMASTFGWSTHHRQGKRHSTLDFDPEQEDSCPGSEFTDGTVACPTCDKSAGSFIEEARQWLDDHDGAVAEDPGYFDETH